MSKQAVRNRRKKIETEDVKPSVKDKFMQMVAEEVEHSEQPVMPKFQAANTRQKQALSMLNEGRSVVFLVGSAGSGKSMIAAYHVSNLLKQKKIDKVWLVRPAVSVGKSIGLLPGDEKMKLAPYFAQTVAHLEKFMGKGHTRYCLEKEIIETKPVEYLRGTSFEHCAVICEEAQNFTAEEMEMMLTRLGTGTVFIFTGDTRQHDLKGTSGLATTLTLLQNVVCNRPNYLEDEDLDLMDDLIGAVEFRPEDVVRSGLTKAFVKMYYNN